MNDEMIYQTIAKQIKEVYGITSLDSKTSINSFNAVSEDNDEFLRRFQKAFQVDMNGFNYYDFFYQDQFYFLAIVRMIMKLFRKEEEKSLLTIEHLINVAKNRKWTSPS